MTDEKRTMLEKAVDNAFKAHPYGFNEPMQIGEWLVGPCFAVKTADYRPISRPKVYAVVDPLIPEKLSSYMEPKGLHPIELQSTGHREKSKQVVNKHGATEEKGGGKCTFRAFRDLKWWYPGGATWELSFPLVTLGKKLKVDVYKSDGKSYAIYGFTKDKELVAVFCPRISPNCVVEWPDEEVEAA